MQYKLRKFSIVFVVINLFLSLAFADDSVEFGLVAAKYRYAEPSVMDLRGTNFGIDYTGILTADSCWFVAGNIMGVYGKADYFSYKTGTHDGEKNWYIDTKAFVGKKYKFDGFSLSPYSGLGYRYLYNDGRGVTTTENKGYQRSSNYFYLPIGIEHQFIFGARSKFISTAEFDYLILGRQASSLSDADLRRGDIINKQTRGYGARLNFKYCLNGFVIGPYLIYWNIAKSDGAASRGSVFFEPKNYTLETGVRIGYRF